MRQQDKPGPRRKSLALSDSQRMPLTVAEACLPFGRLAHSYSRPGCRGRRLRNHLVVGSVCSLVPWFHECQHRSNCDTVTGKFALLPYALSCIFDVLLLCRVRR